MRTKYKFLHRGNDNLYYWEGPHIPGDYRVEIISCNVDWFWNHEN